MSCRKIARAVCMAAAVVMVCAAKAEDCVVTNVVVAPLTDAHWTQNAPYNDYSPKGTTVFTSGWEAGCVAIAAAQELRYWRWPWSLGAVRETSHPVLNENPLALRFDGNVPFDWDNMPDSFSSSETLAQKHAAAHLVLACQSLVQMEFVAGGGEAKKNLPGTMDWYEYVGQYNPRNEGVADALREDFEFGSPVQTGINFKGFGGHEVVGLGFATGTNSVGEAKDLIWLNLGWDGGSDGWYDLSETNASETVIKAVQLGYRPIKSVQIEPVAPISGSSVTINWHLPDCYTNKIDGFTVAKQKLDSGTTTWLDDFSEGKGRTSNAGAINVAHDGLMAWAGTSAGTYTWDEKFLVTSDTVLTYDVGSAYMAGMRARFEAKFDDGSWQRIGDIPLNGDRTSYYDNNGAASTMTTGIEIDLSGFAGKIAQFRVAMEYVSGGIYANYWASMKVDNVSVSDVTMFEIDTSENVSATARSATFSGLTTGETYALCVTPIMTDGSTAVTQTATTTIGTPAATPVFGTISMTPAGTDIMQEGFYTEIAMGWNIIDVECSNAATLEAFPSHQSVLPQGKVTVVNNGGGSFSIEIDASEVAQKWDGQRLILTLKATNSTGESVYKDLELRLVASGVPENIPGGKVWTGASAMFGAENYTAKWSGNVLPTDGDKVTFKTTDAEFGGEMNLNLSTPTALDYVYATGDGQLTISGTSSETLTANILKNDIQVEINSSKFKVNTAIPSTNIVIDSGSCLDCEIDQSRSDYIKKVSGGYVSALTDSELWNGTVVFANYTAAGQSPSDYGNAESTVCLNGVSGWLANNTTFTPAVELVDNGTTPALNWNNGSTGAKETFKKLKGSGTFKTSGSGGAAERVVINDIDDFTGSFDLSLKRIAIGENDPTTSNNGSITVNSGKSVVVHGGSTWKASGGFYFGGSQTITVNGTLNGAIAADGTGTVLSLAPTATVTAASLSFANNTIRLAMTADASPTFSVTGATILTNATIEVALADGMSAGDSIALISAGSFEGVDSATLEGLDGYSLEVISGTLYATKPAEIESPVAAAVWEDDFSADACSEFDGFSIDDWQQTHGANMSSVTIDRANQGLLVDFTEAKGYVTVLVKYSNLAASSSNKRVLFATTANSDYTRDRCGIRLLTDGTVQGLWNSSTTANNDADYGTASTDTVPSAGTLAFVSDKTSGTEAGGVSAYVAASGESLPDSVLWNNHALKAGDIYGLAVGGMCREAAVSGVEAAQGMAITGLAVFTNVLTVAEMNAYKWPSQLPPVDKEKYAVTPEAVWYKDFKTTAKTNDAGRVYTLAVSGTTAPADDAYGSTLTIGDSAAVIDVRNGANGGNVTVLVKYRAASNTVNAPVVTFGETLSNSVKIDVGAYTTNALTLAVNRSYNGGNNKWVALNTAASLNEGEGYMLCARKYNDMLVYVGNSLDDMTGGSTAAPGDITYSCDLIQAIGIGGPSGLPNADATWSAFDGFVVEKVVVFNGYYTPDEILYVEIPEDADTLAIGNGKTWKFAAGTTRTYTNIGTLNTGGTIAITNASELAEGSYTLATWTTAQKKSTGYGHVGTLDVTGLPAGLSAELVYGARAIYLRVWNPTTQAEKGTIKVWPYGDSITEGFNAGGTRANYRVLLAQKLSLLGYNVEMVGCYDKINQQDGIDPSGQSIPDVWKWHSAKHGATAGPTTSAAGRANLCENVDTLSAQAGNPDVVLLLAGANDIVPATGLSAQQVVSSITNIVAHLAVNLPDTKIVVGTQINVEYGYNGNNYSHVTNMIPQVNALLKAYAGALPEALNGKVFLADLNAYVKSGEYGILFDHSSDHLHPDWWGHDQMAEGWLSIITNQFTSTQVFPSATIPAAPTADELGAAAKSELAEYRKGYQLCRRIDAASNLNVASPYAVVGEGAAERIGKVAYFVEYVRADNNAHKWVWVDMDAFGTTIDEVGLPAANHQQVVTRLHVKSNHNGIDDVAANDDSVTGFIELSPYDYNGNVSGVSGAPTGNASCCDWNDTLSTSGSYGCMQVHRISPPSGRGGQVLFAYNNWQSSSSTAEFGIGNFSSHFYRGANDAQTIDYTYTASATKMNAAAYSVKRIEIWTKEKATDTDFPTPYSWIDMYFPELVSGWGSTQYNDFATNKNHSSVKNGYAPWESYVLGLDPTNEMSKFSATIRMEGTTPVVGYSPTNEALKASGEIEYVLQGKPTLTNGWQDVEFNDPGDTNRFFRVNVTW